jgi:phenylalanyl-tRNA synthetase beta chain
MKPFTVEPVKIIYPNGQEILSPDLDEREIEVEVDYVGRRIGAQLSPQLVVDVLKRMCIEATVTASGILHIRIPPTRSDILHACDIMEDVAIGYGFNRIKPTIPNTNTIAQAFNLNKLSDLLRNEMAQAGYSEVLTLSLVRMKGLLVGNSHPN